MVLTREPGGTELGLALRRIVLSRPMRPETEFLLYSADRAEHAATVIRPALQRGAVVLCDRWMDSSLAYQGYGRGLSLEWMQAVSQGFLGGLRPHPSCLPCRPGSACGEPGSGEGRSPTALRRRSWPFTSGS